jgi:hypothetical protein
MFGRDAKLDVSGSFAVSTANYLKLADGGKFNTSLGGGDMLTSAPVTAFGFLNGAPKGVSVLGKDGSAITVSAPLTNGGDITIKAPVLVSLINSNIDATAGRIGGNITIDPIALQLKNSTISASAPLGQGGQINLFTSFLVGPVKTVTSDGSLLLAFNSLITASGGTSSGTVNVTAPS